MALGSRTGFEVFRNLQLEKKYEEHKIIEICEAMIQMEKEVDLLKTI